MSRARIIGCLLGLGLARLAVAQAPPVELVAPRAGATLIGGSEVVLEWRAPATPPGVEEWEAFLSLNGGRNYAFRLTPHLDVALRRVSVRLPALPSRDARLLLRFGDERREAAIELPLRFTIAAPEAAPPATPARVAYFSRGEPVRPGEAGVVGWLAGSRSGGQAVEVEAGETPLGWHEGTTLAAGTAPALAEGPSQSAAALAPQGALQGLAPTPLLQPGSEALPPPTPLDVLSRTQRLNE